MLGTTDAQDMSIRTNSAERMRIRANCAVGIGTKSPTGLLHVQETGRAESSLIVDQPNTATLDAVTVTSATTNSGNGVAAALTAADPGSTTAGVYGNVAASGTAGGAGV